MARRGRHASGSPAEPTTVGAGTAATKEAVADALEGSKRCRRGSSFPIEDEPSTLASGHPGPWYAMLTVHAMFGKLRKKPVRPEGRAPFETAQGKKDPATYA